ncbi:MAG: phasin family protein [Erythrobacter sp.]|jgi:phasin family protein|nr:phasin family protein [Erythrobacter sp.]
MSEVETTAAEAKAPVAKIDAAAEKAYAEAASKAVAAPKAEKAAPKAAVVKKAAAPKKRAAPVAAKKPAAKKVAAKKPAAKTVAAKKAVTPKKPAPVKKAASKASKPAAAPATNPVIKLKDTIMATAKNTDITATAKEMLADVQTRAKTAYAKTTELAGEATEFSKANVDAVVESGKIFFAGAQDIVKSDIETGKTVLETVTEDAKKVAAIKSPTELMQLQGEIARRNFDALVAFGSKRTEAWVKLYNDAFAPISNRVSVAAEKISKAA